MTKSNGMKNEGDIHGLDSLEKEIYRLRLKASEMEKKLDNNFAWLRENATTLIARSLFSRKKTDPGKNKNGEEGYFRSEKLNSMISKISDRITEGTAAKIDGLLDSIFQNRK